MSAIHIHQLLGGVHFPPALNRGPQAVFLHQDWCMRMRPILRRPPVLEGMPRGVIPKRYVESAMDTVPDVLRLVNYLGQCDWVDKMSLKRLLGDAAQEHVEVYAPTYQSFGLVEVDPPRAG